MMRDTPSAWHTPVPAGHPAASLLTTDAVRMRCASVAAWVKQGASRHFVWHEARLPLVAAYVADTIRARHPDLAVPYHSRNRHFEAGGVDRWQALVQRHSLQQDADERARTAIDLVIPSVLLDAGAGPQWRFEDAATGQVLARSEGLGVASLRMFEAGTFSSEPAQPLQSDAQGLMRVTPESLAHAFQAAPGNELVGLAGRAALIRRLGEVVAATPAVFGQHGSVMRLGHLYDYLRAHASAGKLAAGFVVQTLLHALGPVWPGRAVLAGVPLGDCWRHPALADGWVPFHKLTQWLAYSLLEPLQDGGLEMTGLDALTGLPEYRNGGLLLDLGLLEPRSEDFATRAWQVEDEAIVEWRAVTVHALDRIAQEVRAVLGVSAAQFPLARVLEGGTWAAGRRIAAEKRQGGGPPLTLVSDGTVF